MLLPDPIPDDHQNDREMEIESSLEIFKKDVLEGFSKKNKQIPSQYFYDEQGSKLFNQITKHPDYYLTNCDIEILQTHKGRISNFLKGKNLNVIELGPGEGIKTKLLIEQFLKDNIDFKYIPVDVCNEYLLGIQNQLQNEYQHLSVEPKPANYLKCLEFIQSISKRPNLILFLGSSIGGLDLNSAHQFFDKVSKALNPGDYILTGFDLCKDISLLIKAYNDSDGITRDFNFNLLHRMNRELNANFNIGQFCHYGSYNAQTKAMESYLVSLVEQEVFIAALEKTFVFEPFEAIHVEYSLKYTLPQIQQFADNSHFEIIENFLDSKGYFVNSLWRLK